MDRIFTAVVQATEEAIINALVDNQAMTGRDNHRVDALPHDRMRALLRKYNRHQCSHHIAGAYSTQLPPTLRRGRHGSLLIARILLDAGDKNGMISSCDSKLDSEMSTEIKKEIQLEIAHVLFIDIVGYSKLSINDQRAG